jgi:hypothetical protein
MGFGFWAPANASASEPTVTSFSQAFCIKEIEPNIRWDFDMTVTEVWNVSDHPAVLLEREIALDVTGTGLEHSFFQHGTYLIYDVDSEVWPELPDGVCINFDSSSPGPSHAYLTYSEAVYTNWTLGT